MDVSEAQSLAVKAKRPLPRAYTLAVLFIIYVFSFIDRNVLGVLLPQIKTELVLADWQLGFIGGIAFALFYVICGLPLASWADRGNRVNIIAICISLWSVMTASTALAGNFFQLVLARIGVAVGEAGSSPASQSILADLYEPERRASVLGIYMAGGPTGIFVALLTGGYLAEAYGWRNTFIILGLAGLVMPILLKLTVKEPVRGAMESRPDSAAPPLLQTLTLLFSRPAFRHVALASALSAFVGYGTSLWLPSFLVRSYGLSLGQAGLFLAVLSAAGSIGGMILGGYLADALARRDRRLVLWVPGAGMALGAVFAAGAFLSQRFELVLFCLALQGGLGNLWPGPAYATAQQLVGLRMRAAAIAILLFIINIIGLGLGPFIVGALSDVFAAVYGNESLRYSLLWTATAGMAWSAVHFYFAGRHLLHDLDRAPA